MTISRRLAAILAADIVGYSALMAADEEGTVRSLKAHQAAVLPLITDHEGRVIDTAGDGILAEFPSVLNAVKCALAFQATMELRNAEIDPQKAIRFRIGINQGDLIIDEGRAYGDGVNIAARLEAFAEPGGIVISSKVHEEVRGKVEAEFEDWGLKELKNIARPVQVYALRPSRSAATRIGRSHITAPAEQPALAVLPFDNMSGDPKQEYFADGITEDIITALSRIKWFSVIARNSSFLFKGKAVDIRHVGRELGVRYVLEGSVRKSGQQLRITAQLIEAESGNHVWAEKYDGNLSDIFELQDRITQSVASVIEPNIRLAEIARFRRTPPANLKAYDYWLRALADYGLALSKETNAAAIANFRLALEADPHFVHARGFLAIACLLRKAQGWATEAEAAEGLRAAEEVIRSGTQDPMPLAHAGFVVGFLGNRIDEGLRCTELAYAINPNAAIVQSCSGWMNYYSGNFADAAQRFTRALKLSPTDPIRHHLYAGLSLVLFSSKRFDEGLEAARRAIADSPTYISGHRAMIANLVGAGRLDEAREKMKRLIVDFPTLSRRTLAFPNPVVSGPYIEALSQAGLPE